MKSKDDNVDPRDSRPVAGWVSLCLAPVYAAVEELQELRKQGIVKNNECIYNEDTWPRNPNTGRRLEFISGSYARPADVNNLIFFFESNGMEAFLNAADIDLNIDAIRKRLDIHEKRNRRTAGPDPRRAGSAPLPRRRTIPSTTGSGSKDLCRTLPAIAARLNEEPPTSKDSVSSTVTPAEPESQTQSVLMGFPSVVLPAENPSSPAA